MKQAVVVGGGITGLSAAYMLHREAAKSGAPVRVTVIESDSRWGGKILTDRPDGFVIEAGPDAILARKPWAIELWDGLGIRDQAVPTAGEGSFIRIGSRLEPLPQGMSMLVPGRIGPFVTSRLFTPWGKLRMAMEYFIPPRRSKEDESLASFVTRRLGREALERMAEPLLSGIYAGDAAHMSLEATFPQFRRMEEEYGGLIKTMLARKRNSASRSPQGSPPERRRGQERKSAPGTMFVSLAQGLGSMVASLVEDLEGSKDAEGILGDGVQSLERLRAEGAQTPGEQMEDGRSVRYRIRLQSGRVLEADAVILALPAFAAAGLLKEIAPDAARELRAIPYASVAGVVLAYERDRVNHPLNGTGYVVARTQKGPVTACTWASSKWPHAAPEDKALFRIHIGRAGDDEAASWPDDRLIEIARDELKRVMGIDAPPILERVYRWPSGMPQYEVGHLDRLRRIESSLAEAPGVFATGSAFRGIGVPDCVRQGFDAAHAAAAYLA